MLTAKILDARFSESYGQIRQAITPITHSESLRPPLPGLNPLHWLVGHVVVSRANFLTLLDVPSIWPWEICKLFVPGSRPTAESAAAIPFEALRHDLERTQELLLAALARTGPDALAALHDERPLADHLLEYATHEAFHAGQITLLQQILTAGSTPNTTQQK